MAYHTHITDAIVLGSTPSGEANQMIYFFTRELGLVRAFARSSRVERSKLRPLLQDLTRGTVSLVRGKEYWRVIGMADASSFYYALRQDRRTLGIYVRLSLLMRRLLHGEEKNEPLFDLHIATATALLAAGSGEEGRAIEVLAAARILERLGHMPRSPFEKLLAENAYDRVIVDEALTRRRELTRAVNEALRESGL